MISQEIVKYVADHAFEIIHLVAEIGIVIWALFKKADKFILAHLETGFTNIFMTKEDGKRLEHKVDLLLSRHLRVVKRIASHAERKSPDTN